MASAILHELAATNLFDLTGVVAVITGGGTVSERSSGATVLIIFALSYRVSA